MFQLATPMLPCPPEVRHKDLEKFTDLVRKRKGTNRVILDEPLATLLNIEVIQWYQSFNIGEYMVRQYFLPDQRGKVIGSVTVFSSNTEINSRVDGPDEILEEISLADIGLKRNPAAQKGHKGQGLTRHFAKNFVGHKLLILATLSLTMTRVLPTNLAFQLSPRVLTKLPTVS